MSKKSKSKKRIECFDDMPIVAVKKSIKKKRFYPETKLRNPNFVAKAFFQALVENDVDAALDAIEGYLLATGKEETVRRDIPPSTFYNALSQGANPTLKTVARLLHSVG